MQTNETIPAAASPSSISTRGRRAGETTDDPSCLDAERIVPMNGNKYAVHLSCGDSSVVQVLKSRPSGGEYRQTIKYNSQNWKRAVRIAREMKAAGL